MFKNVITLLFLSICTIAFSQDAKYHEVKPKKGDGVLSLLRRYHLEKDACNLKTFYRINKMKKGDGLKGHLKYKIPILLYSYNGKSIRSTIGDNNYKKALSIQKYNERILKEGQRHKSYRVSKILWVPQHILGCNSKPSTIKKEQKSKKQQEIQTVKTDDDSKISNDSLSVNNNSKTDILKKDNKKVTSPKDKKKTETTTRKIKKGKFGYKTEKLFGKQNQKVAVIDQSLKGHVYYIVSGHGGPDSGAMCKKCPKTMCEDEYAYDIGLRLARDLMEHGAVVNIIVEDKNDGIRDAKYLKCDRDERVNGRKLPLNQKKRLNQRAARINELYRRNKKRGYKKQVAVFLHVDSQSAKRRQDVFFYHKKNSSKGKKVCQNLTKTLKEKYAKHQKGRGYKGHVSSRGLYVLNYTQPTSVFVELANIRNKKDHQRLILSSNREVLAQWLYEGLAKK